MWYAIDHRTGEILAYVLAPHVDVALKELMALLAPFGIHRFYTDGWGAYARILDEILMRLVNATLRRLSASISTYGLESND
ncbi:IS1 family transposase [Leptolyngbya sp. FACHB-16]|uniref:IS1 family transposase n=1 Tax=unclassified Leptolyngbya TaxID=2650499 RepID=UPI0024116066|nr:IS1 family transposase [Leptolyngbya sp. FACHB-16]